MLIMLPWVVLDSMFTSGSLMCDCCTGGSCSSWPHMETVGLMSIYWCVDNEWWWKWCEILLGVEREEGIVCGRLTWECIFVLLLITFEQGPSVECVLIDPCAVRTLTGNISGLKLDVLPKKANVRYPYPATSSPASLRHHTHKLPPSHGVLNEHNTTLLILLPTRCVHLSHTQSTSINEYSSDQPSSSSLLALFYAHPLYLTSRNSSSFAVFLMLKTPTGGAED